MVKLYTINDVIIELEKSRAQDMAKETELKWQLQKSLSEFSDFLKDQEAVRKKKFEETNPGIARYVRRCDFAANIALTRLSNFQTEGVLAE